MWWRSGCWGDTGQADIGYGRGAAVLGAESSGHRNRAAGNPGCAQAAAHMGLEPGLISGRPFDLSGCAMRARIRRCRVARPPRDRGHRRLRRCVVRTVAPDVHKRFAEIALHEDGGLRRLGRIETRQLQAFAESLGPEDHVVLESTSMTWAIAELLSAHGGVTVSNPMRTRAIASAKVKTDEIDAKVVAQLARRTSAGGVGARRVHAGVAQADRAPLEPRASARPAAQPDPRRAGAEPDLGAVHGCVRPRRPPVAGRGGAA